MRIFFIRSKAGCFWLAKSKKGMFPNSSSSIELSRLALENNIDFLRKLVGPDVTISSVLKGNAYGHGIKHMVPELERLGIRHFSVFGSFEALDVASFSTESSTILIMGDILDDHMPWMIENDVECFVFNKIRLNALCKQARLMKKKARIHLELETGMNRTGINPSEWKEMAALLQDYSDCIEVIGMCTHFAGAESVSNYKRILNQKEIFSNGVAYFKGKGINPTILHTSCSAGAIMYPENNLNMVRIGILQYGLWPSQETQVSYMREHKLTEDPLSRVISWRSHVMDIKTVKMGEFIGYGTSFLAEYDMRVASVPVGYSYGFSRGLSNHGRVLINGHRLSVVGVVNMNMFLVEITHAEVNIGDKVTLIGNDGDLSISVSHFSNLSEQLNYELLTRLDKDIPRVVS